MQCVTQPAYQERHATFAILPTASSYAYQKTSRLLLAKPPPLC